MRALHRARLPCSALHHANVSKEESNQSKCAQQERGEDMISIGWKRRILRGRNVRTPVRQLFRALRTVMVIVKSALAYLMAE